MSDSINQYGVDPKDLLLQMYDTEEKRFKRLTTLTAAELEEYKKMLAHLELVHEANKAKKEAKGKKRAATKTYTTEEKGKALEDLVSFIIKKSSIFKLFENLRNTTNEIDHLLKYSYIGNELIKQLKLPGDIFLSECKNYDGKVDVTWVGKFYSLLQSNSVKLGLLFSYHGLAGRGEWHSAIGLTKKLYLLREDLENRTYIIDININDFRAIANGKNLLAIINAKMDALRFQTNFQKFLNEKHPAELEKASKASEVETVEDTASVTE